MPNIAQPFDNENFVIDPRITGFDSTFWATITGSDPADPSTTSNKIRVNNATIASFANFQGVDLEFILNVPVAPTSGQDKEFGLTVPALGDRGRVVFNITDDELSVKVFKDAGGTAILDQVIAWDGDWTATDTSFRIVSRPSVVEFLIGGTRVAKYPISRSKQNPNPEPPELPMPIYIKNGNSDNLDVAAILLRHIKSFT